jgi:hypothetical protein
MTRLNLLISLLLSSIYLTKAQTSQEVYSRAIDEINCTMTKTLLVSYDRPVAARMIQTCNYSSITNAIDKVQENTIKGYKKLIAEAAQNINAYKQKIPNPTEYSLYESTLEEAQTLALRQYEDVCGKNKGANSSVCAQMEQKALKLQSELNSIVGAALPKIAKQTYGNTGKQTAQANAAAETPTEKTTTREEVPRQEYNSETPNNAAELSNDSSSSGGSSIWSMLSAIIIVALVAAVAWLFKENRELKEKMDDITMLLKMLNQKK